MAQVSPEDDPETSPAAAQTVAGLMYSASTLSLLNRYPAAEPLCVLPEELGKHIADAESPHRDLAAEFAIRLLMRRSHDVTAVYPAFHARGRRVPGTFTLTKAARLKLLGALTEKYESDHGR